MDKKKKPGIDLGLSRDDKATLYAIARTAIESALNGIKPPHSEITSDILREKRGAFVSLHLHGNLRGCIGYIQPSRPLHKTVQEMSIAAALQDPRFDPVTKQELEELEIEISVLTPMVRIEHTQEIEIGRHGLYIVSGPYHGLLLPQVATSYSWDRKTFLEHTCEKAGLPKNAWMDKNTEIYIFSADIF
jgi:AmmeMemoRadiSam system protein A